MVGRGGCDAAQRRACGITLLPVDETTAGCCNVLLSYVDQQRVTNG